MSLRTSDVFTVPGPEVRRIYVENRMTVHFQGMSKTLQFPHTIALQGAPTCSIGISPEGLYNRLNDAGRLILLNQNAIQFGSAPFVRVGDKTRDAHDAGSQGGRRAGRRARPQELLPSAGRGRSRPRSRSRHRWRSCPTSCAKVDVVRRLVSPFLSRSAHALMPVGVEEFEITNTLGPEPAGHARDPEAVARQSAGEGAEADGPGHGVRLRGPRQRPQAQAFHRAGMHGRRHGAAASARTGW